MANKPRKILNLSVTISGVQYVLGTLRFNSGEFSYFFTYPSDSPERHLNIDTGEETSCLEHITWHDGQIHIKRKDNIAVQVVNFPGPLLSTPPMLTPIYVESFYFKNVPCLVGQDEFTPWSGSVSQEVLSLETSGGFSLIFLLTPSSKSTPEVLMGLQFANIPEGLLYAPSLADLCDIKHRPMRILVWEGWDVVVVATPFLQSTLSPIPSKVGAARLPNYRNVPAALTDLMLQANGLKVPMDSSYIGMEK